MTSTFREFLKLEVASGVMLVAAAALAMVLANTPLAAYYDLLIDMPVQVQVGALNIAKPLLLWINDGLMVVFFFLIGLELKREVLEGELRDVSRVALPAMGALGGMLVPALIYAGLNWQDPMALRGWAIPAATDIAFVLGILALLGNRVPLSLKVFLVSLAIFDDIGAIVVIAAFYTADLSMTSLAFALALMPLLFYLNRRGVMEKTPYVLIGVAMWVAMLKSGVHATLAGVLLAAFIPMQDPVNPGQSPLKELEHDLHGAVAFAILPLFAFANSGIRLSGGGVEHLLHSVPLGIAAGLFFGKQIGVFSFCWLGIKMGLTKLPEGTSWLSLYGAALLCGVGFTMSLFIGSLAFEQTGSINLFDERLGIIAGSIICGVGGFIVLRFSLSKDK